MKASYLAHIEPPADLSTIKRFISSLQFASEYDAPDSTAACQTRLKSVTLGAVRILRHAGLGRRTSLRRMDHIRKDHVDDILISLPFEGRSVFTQGGTEVLLDPGHFAILKISHPFSISITSAKSGAEFLQYSAIVPGPMLRLRVPRIDNYCDKAIRITPGAGAIMSSMLEISIREGEALSEAQSRSFGEIMADAIANCIREAPELSGFRAELQVQSHARVREQAEYFIKSNISNPTLGPRLVAEHCKVSARYLNEVFCSASMTVVSLIRETRLDCCRESLLSPELSDRSIFEIALRWGFNDPAHFSRAYKAKFGHSPREDRRLQHPVVCRFENGTNQSRVTRSAVYRD